jgi:lipopolysaccharide biosynthesis glycosyltransferase
MPAADPIHLLFAADARYGPWAGVSIAAALRANPGARFHLHLLSDRIRRRDLERLASLAARAGALLSIYDLAATLDAERDCVGDRHHLSRAACGRFFVARLMPSDLAGVLYLDCDVICRAPLGALWRLGERLPLVAAAREQPDNAERKRALGIPVEGAYYNAGVMLINLDAWRRECVGERLLDYAAARPETLLWLDQDAINAVLWRAITELAPEWNLQLLRLSAAEAEARIGDAALVHFNGRVKPWSPFYRGPGAALYRAAKRASPWRWQKPDFRLGPRLRKAVNKRLARRRPAHG